MELNWGYIAVTIGFVVSVAGLWGAALPALAVCLGLLWLGMTLTA